MSQALVLVEVEDGVATVTMNRPEKLNALSRELRSELVNVFTRLREDRAVGAVVLTGAGRGFCAGLDLRELSDAGEDGGPDPVTDQNVLRAITDFDRPVIGAINGVAITGGFEVALACDVLIASTEARFADTHARVGILPGWGLSQKLGRTIGVYRAKELSLTGNYLSAEQAERWGLVNRVVAPEKLLSEAKELAADMLTCDPVAQREILALIDEGNALPLGEALALERRRSAEHRGNVTPEVVAERREAIQRRGRAQSGGSR